MLSRPRAAGQCQGGKPCTSPRGIHELIVKDKDKTIGRGDLGLGEGSSSKQSRSALEQTGQSCGRFVTAPLPADPFFAPAVPATTAPAHCPLSTPGGTLASPSRVRLDSCSAQVDCFVLLDLHPRPPAASPPPAAAPPLAVKAAYTIEADAATLGSGQTRIAGERV